MTEVRYYRAMTSTEYISAHLAPNMFTYTRWILTAMVTGFFPEMKVISVTRSNRANIISLFSVWSSRTYTDVIAQVVKTRGLKVTRIAPPPKGPNAEQGNINISGSEPKKISEDLTSNQKNIVSEIMTEYGEFYAEIQFDHQ